MPGPEALYSCRGQASPKGRAISLALLVPFLGDRPAEVGALCLSSASFAYGQVIYLHPIPLLFFPQEDADFCPLLCRSPCLCSPPWVMTEATTEEACHQQGTCLGGSHGPRVLSVCIRARLSQGLLTQGSGGLHLVQGHGG